MTRAEFRATFPDFSAFVDRLKAAGGGGQFVVRYAYNDATGARFGRPGDPGVPTSPEPAGRPTDPDSAWSRDARAAVERRMRGGA